MGTIMDLAALSGSFATIVGLLTSFKAERSSNDLPSFFGWRSEGRCKDGPLAVELDCSGYATTDLPQRL